MNKRDVQDAKLMGKAKYLEWKKEFMGQWQAPDIDLAKAQFWKEVQPYKEELRSRAPEAVANMEARYG